MPTTPAERTHSRGPVPGLAVLLCLVLAVAGLTGCRAGSDDPASSPDADVVGALTRLVARHQRALVRDDPAGLRRTVRGREVLQDQTTYAANLAQLPLAGFELSLQPATLVRDGDAITGVVETLVELDGFDTAPVTTPHRWRFEQRRGSWRATAVRDPRWAAEHAVTSQPWETGAVVVRRTPGVLGVFDADSVAGAPRLLAEVRAGIAEVSARVPYDWERQVVVYALADTRALAALPGLPGGDPDAVDAVAFPVWAGRGTSVAGVRFVLHPRMLEAPARQRARLVRHELTHVALGSRDDAVPTWLSEGIAEWVSVQALDPSERTLASAAVAAARDGYDALPEDAEFNGTASDVHYGLSWWACEAVVDLGGEPALWALLDELAHTPEDESDRVVRRFTGLSGRELAGEAGRRILATYADDGTPAPAR